MAEAVVKKPTTKVIDTWKTKRWYKIISPQMLGANQIGETVAAEESQLIGRTINISLGAIINDMKKQNTNAILEITKINAGNAETEIKKLEIVPSSIRRMVRKGKERIDLSLVCATKDNVLIRIKPFVATRGKVGGSVLTKMTNLLDAVLRVEASRTNYENLMADVIHGKLQKTAKQRLNKLYPVKTSEIRSIEKTIFAGKLPPVPVLPEIVEEKLEETEEEKIAKKAQHEDNIEITEIKSEEKHQGKALSISSADEKQKKAKKAEA
ncbi:TPA: hypothetical protein HA219_01145 [Candidatus Woesearchaeota archaeon]|nr:hypothetical protein [Candidatus Woesearchaeota archaeon]HIH39313.1 hypothetical protein [Candidatus Woesearchaeota archaeon]